MRTLSEKYKELAQRAGRYPKLRMELYAGTRGEWTDTVEAEYDGESEIISATYTNGITAKPTRFETGLAFSGAVELVLSGEAYPSLSEGKRFRLFGGFLDPETGTVAEEPIGEFFVEAIAEADGKTTVKARDKMLFAEQKFKATALTYPRSLSSCLKEIFHQMGFTLPEDYTLAIDPTVVAPAWTKPNATEGIYSNGTFYVVDPEGYGIMLPGATEPTKGHAYLADSFSLTCREAIASVAKMQLGNAFIDADGLPRFSAYIDSPPIGDGRITGLTVGSESFEITRVTEAYLGYDDESTHLYKRKLDEWKGEIIYYTNFPSELPATLEPIKSRIVGKEFFEGTIERKGIGELELGDFADYAGTRGEKRFFIFGIQREWSGASFDETIYSFAPDYKGVSYEWLNDRDLVSDEEKSDTPTVDTKPNVVPDVGGGNTISIGTAVIIAKSDSKLLLHEYHEIEYFEGDSIGYAGPENQIVVNGYIAYARESILGVSTSAGGSWNSADDMKNFLQSHAYYTRLTGQMVSTSTPAHIADTTMLKNVRADNTYTVYQQPWYHNDVELGNHTELYSRNSSSGPAFVLLWKSIYPPGYDYGGVVFPFGAVLINLKIACDNVNNKSYPCGLYDTGGYWRNILIGFSSVDEYNAAVGLTYEPAKRIRIEDHVTEVEGKEEK